MGRIVERLRAVPPGQAALMLVVAALVTALVYFGGREAGVTERSEAGTSVAQEQPVEAAQQGDGDEGDTEPLTLTLSAPTTCEATRAGQAWSNGRYVDEDGVERSGDFLLDWWHPVEEVDVEWAVSGGTEPYTLTIDGETKDHVGDYAGASGTASVSCGSETSGAFIVDPAPGWGGPKERRYRTDPQLEAGLKTIRATVVDGAGATAEASAGVHVIMRIAGSGRILESGKTYRVYRFLVTVPDGMTLVTGTKITEEGGPWIALDVVGAERQTWIWLATATGEDGGRYFFHPSRGHVKTDGSWYRTYDDLAKGLEPERMEVSDEIRRIDAQFDELVESINRIPAVERAD